MSFHNLFSHIMKFHESITDTLTGFKVLRGKRGGDLIGIFSGLTR